jgi:glycosyl transferase family 87
MSRIGTLDVRRRAPLLVAVALYALAAGIVAWRVTAVDYPVYLIAASGFSRGEDVYRWSADDFRREGARLGIARHEFRYPYPPLTALVVVPLLAVPYRLGLFLWTALNGLAVVATGLVLAGFARGDGARRTVAIAVWSFVPFLTGIYAGQVNPLVVLLAAIAVGSLERRRDALAGAILAASLLMKPLAIGVLLYGAWRGRVRFLAACAVATAALLAIAVAAFGSSALGFAGAVSSWTPRSYPPSQNLPGLAARWFGDGSGLAFAVGAALSAAVAAATIALCRPSGRARSWSRAELAAVVAAVLIAHAATWYHHYAMLAIAMALLWADADRDAKFRRALLVLAYVLVEIFGIGWHRFDGMRLAFESATIGAALVWVVAALGSRRETAGSDRRPDGERQTAEAVA